MEKLWHNKTAIVINKMNMVSLDFLAIVDLHLGRAKSWHENLSVILGGLSIVILFGDFFQFLLVIGQFFWKVPLSSHKKHKQHIWCYFTAIITLTKQIHPQDDIVFQQLLKRVRTGYLTQKDVDLLNNKVSKKLSTSNNLSLVIIV